ncbi:MAG: hypothetical protein LAT62_16125 [Natronospirillum sp.]|uniref:hypothetical protein n=1 Tax=Natronospirillum sp. TaxID=2812955 RepID=UPI0025F09F31|nr:hypothetical protein [Natronospirillum sp.]MCH8553465.1 hypothetical protein [Natronospirillum sp.]
MGRLQRLLLLVLAGLVAGCANEPDDDFFAQPEWANYLDRIPADMGFEPAVTDWERDQSLETDLNECKEAQDTPEAWAVFHDLIDTEESDHLIIDIRTRYNQDDTATGLVQRWGLKDDAVAGSDHQLALEEIDGCWQPTRVEVRHYCRRGKSEDNLCL